VTTFVAPRADSPRPDSTRDLPAMTTPAFAEIFARHARFVAQSLRRMGVADADLDDVCQEAFLVVHRRLGSFEGRSSLRTWIRGVAIRVAADYRKSARVRARAGVESTDELESPWDDHGRTEARQILQRAFSALDANKRAVLVLHEIEGFSVPEVALLVGCPVPTAYTRLRAGRLILARTLSDEAPPPPPRRRRWGAC
jgi:RNA polymerase sigma-70 factor (ECF subfamily)